VSEERKPIPQEDFITLVKKAINTGNLKLIDLELNFEIDLILLLCQMGIQARKEDGNTYYIDCPFDIFIANTVFKKLVSIEAKPFYDESAPVENDQYCILKIRFPKKYIHCLLCSDSVFESDFLITGATFQSSIAFTNVNFNKDASFRENLFKNEAVSFQNVTVKGLLQFTHSKFEGNAYFTNSSFESGVCFGLSSFEKEKEVSFENSSFSKETKFERTQFKGHSKFKNSKFLKNSSVIFDHITTHDYLGIVPSELNGEIIIKDTSFESDKRSLVVDLEKCLEESTGNVQFENIELDSSRICIKVRNLKKESKVTVHFKECGFYGKNVALTHVDLSKLRLDCREKGNWFAGFSFYFCEWDSITQHETNWNRRICLFLVTLILVPLTLMFLKSDWLQLFYPFLLIVGVLFAFLAFHNRTYSSIAKETHELIVKDVPKNEASMIYLQLKGIVQGLGESQIANHFHFWELYFKREDEKQRKKKDWVSSLYKHASFYGLSISRPLALFWSIVLLGALIYMIPLHSFREGLDLSLQNSVTLLTAPQPLPIDKYNPDLLKQFPFLITTGYMLVSSLQKLIQAFLIFQMGAAIRNKVKR
jgi:hypothetical protein